MVLLDFADGYLDGLDEIEAALDDSKVKLPTLLAEFKRINESISEIGESAGQEAIKKLIQSGDYAVLNKLQHFVNVVQITAANLSDKRAKIGVC